MDSIPACAEDVVIERTHTGWICGPAADDGTINLFTDSCSYLVGMGNFEEGFWDSYQCASFANVREGQSAHTLIPNTATPEPELDTNQGIFGEALGGVLLIGAFTAAAIRAHFRERNS